MNARSILIVVALVGAWCALWETVSIANVLSGFLVAVPIVALSGSTAIAWYPPSAEA